MMLVIMVTGQINVSGINPVVAVVYIPRIMHCLIRAEVLNNVDINHDINNGNTSKSVIQQVKWKSLQS